MAIRATLASSVRETKRQAGLEKASMQIVSGKHGVKCVTVSHGVFGPSASVFCTVNQNQQYRLANESCMQPSL